MQVSGYFMARVGNQDATDITNILSIYKSLITTTTTKKSAFQLKFFNQQTH